TYAPGRWHRPANDSVVPESMTDDWRQCRAFLWGVDLWNHGFPWEAHEAWEGPWRASTDRDRRELLRGLIQCAAARVQRAAGKPTGARSLLARGLGRLRSSGKDPCMGVAVGQLADELDRAFANGDEAPPLVLVGFDEGPV
ncbi:MAG: DUF309 domain-containing protein, partial [Deltaproteobacteria bacterium]|nr:DUF309 domain-containing protein [Deltaproteobacteria bacterium]